MKHLCMALLMTMAVAARPIAQAQTTAPDVVGAWDVTSVSPVGENTNVMEIRKEGDALKAYAKGEQGERQYQTSSPSPAAT